jgi:uncharacterized protein (UPF0264 family)
VNHGRSARQRPERHRGARRRPGGAALIDVKEPAKGPLGPAPAEVVGAVVDAVAGRAPVSAARGELVDAGEEAFDPSRLAYVKWGLAGCADRDWAGAWRRRRGAVEGSGCRVVAAAYADWRRAGAPAVGEVLHLAIAERAAVLLVDTWGKDGTTLLDWLSISEVVELADRCRSAGVRVALAGSLGAREIEALARARPDWFAVRGAACGRGQRQGEIDEARVRRLADAAAGGE